VSEQRFNPQAKLTIHRQFQEFIAGGKVYPINYEVCPTHVCQAKCSWCFYSGTHLKMGPDSVMDFKVAEELIDDIASLKASALTWSGGGEPTLHPKFADMVARAASVGLKQGLFTNALSMPKYDPSLLEWIRVSNTDRDWNVGVMKTIREKAKVLGMAINYVGDDAGIHRALEVADEVGVNYVQVRQALALRGYLTDRKPPQINHPKLMVTTYKFEDCTQPHQYQECYGFNFVPFIWHDGDVDVCGYHRKKGAPYTLGNLHQMRLPHILLRAPRSVPVCTTCQVCCKNHEANKAVNTALALEDVDFV
jgi:MoaA/NifB/PqqE/SkfB family radical SAM enzyme